MRRRACGRQASAGAPRDRGAADALGLVLIAPAVIGLAILVVALGRGVDAKAQLRSAAESAAQAAALERNPVDARRAAEAVAFAMLAPDGEDTDACQGLRIDTQYPPIPPAGSSNTVGLVRVTLSCAVSDRGIEAVQSGARDDQITAVAAVDFFRARSG